MSQKHFLEFYDLNKEELEKLFIQTKAIKEKHQKGEEHKTLKNKSLVMLFEKPSTRTRLSFEIGMQQMGGTAVYLNGKDSQLSTGETLGDTASVISGFCDILMIRTHGHDLIKHWSKHSKVPVINALTNEHHPCQVLADIYTYIEKKGSIQGKTVAYVGVRGNILNSWIQAAEVLDFTLHISNPKIDKKPHPHNTKNIKYFEDPTQAVENVDIVTTDVWVSLGDKVDKKSLQKDYIPWQVNKEMMQRTRKDTLFMHCLPAFRGEEVTSEVIDGPQSVIWDEAENRLHVQKALLEFLLLGSSHA